MSQENPYWPDGIAPGETATYYFMNERHEELPGVPGMCFKDGVYFCDDPECSHPLTRLVLMEVDKMNALYQKAEEELKK